LSAQFANFKD